MEEASLPPERRIPPLLFPYNSNDASLAGLIARWVRRHQVDAVLCNWGNILDLLESENLKVPDAVACATLCLCEPFPPRLAGVRPHLRALGERAVSIVVAQLKSSERGAVPVLTLQARSDQGWGRGAGLCCATIAG